jgi:alcohol dehydrogenase YqhD (iron-dependent ADH family)
MHNFNLYLPTKLFFGQNRLSELPQVLKPLGSRILITYGGGSIIKSGLLDTVKKSLRDFTLFELSGIEPNPRITSVRDGAAICKKEKIDILLAIGGGSVLDCTKNIACGAYYDGDPWDLVLDTSKITRALPIVDIITLAATGSEYDAGGVITNLETNEKRAIIHSLLSPYASFCDPSLTQSVPAWHTAAGAADIMSHTFEQYFVKDGNILTDGFCEAMLRTVIQMTPVAIKDPNNYEARAQLLMASSFGCCNLLCIGRSASAWPCHAIEHEISAFHDITHGVGLAIITPHWMRYSLNTETAPKFAQYGRNVWNLTGDDTMVIAREAIDRTAQFFTEIGIPSKLSDVGVTDKHFEEMADHIPQCWSPLTDAFVPIDRNGVLEILKNSL